MRVKGLMFDFDGTIADTWNISNEAMKATYLAFTGEYLSDETVLGYTGPTEEEFVRRLLPGVPNTVEFYLAEFVRQHKSVTDPFPGIVPVIESIKSCGVAVSMITAKGPKIAELSFAQLPVRHLFESVYTATAESIRKVPHIHDQLERWSLNGFEAAYIGDTVSDMTQALEAGVTPLGAAWGGFATGEALSNAGAASVFTHPSQLLQWLTE